VILQFSTKLDELVDLFIGVEKLIIGALFFPNYFGQMKVKGKKNNEILCHF
jgi:hypothetical protein